MRGFTQPLTDDEKSIHHTVEQAKARQQRKPKWKPPVDHPWRRPLTEDSRPVTTI